MKKVIRWILLVWAILTIPYTLDVPTAEEFFFGLLFLGLIIGLMISDLREEAK